MQDLLPRQADRGYVSFPRRVDGLTLALRLCVDRAQGKTLAQLFRRVPGEYVGRATRLADKREVSMVACPCGAGVEVGQRLAQCECGRWFVADERGAWAAKLDA